jgi:hypothetical protein
LPNCVYLSKHTSLHHTRVTSNLLHWAVWLLSTHIYIRRQKCSVYDFGIRLWLGDQLVLLCLRSLDTSWWATATMKPCCSSAEPQQSWFPRTPWSSQGKPFPTTFSLVQTTLPSSRNFQTTKTPRLPRLCDCVCPVWAWLRIIATSARLADCGKPLQKIVAAVYTSYSEEERTLAYKYTAAQTP